MTLSHFRVTNFKCFSDTSEIALRPLTILVGANNSGKSSLIQSIYLPAQTLRSEDPSLPLRLSSGEADFGTFSDLVFGHDLSKIIKFEFVASDCRTHVPEKIRMKHPHSHYDFCGRLSFSIGFMPRKKQIYLKQFTVSIDEVDCLSVNITNKYTGSVKVESSVDVLSSHNHTIASLLYPLNFLFVPELRYTRYRNMQKEVGADTAESMFSILDDFALLTSEVRWQLFNTYYLGPLRLPPSRSYAYSGERPKWVGTRGERAMQLLALLQTSAADEEREYLRRIQFDLARLGFMRELTFEQISARHFEAWTRHPESDLAGNLADTGFGASQVLPVVVSIHTSVDGAVCLYEQPEIHLHPSAQAELGSVFVEAVAKYPNKKFVVETHSENLILRVLREIVERRGKPGSVDPEDVAIYYVEPGSRGHTITKMVLDEYGRFINSWPRGFFEEGYLESTALARARLEAIDD